MGWGLEVRGGEEAWIAVSFSCYFIYLFIPLFVFINSTAFEK